MLTWRLVMDKQKKTDFDMAVVKRCSPQDFIPKNVIKQEDWK